MVALNGFTSIDAEVTFNTDADGGLRRKKVVTVAADNEVSTSKENVSAGENTSLGEAVVVVSPKEPAVPQADEGMPVHLQFRFRREAMLDVGGQCGRVIDQECEDGPCLEEGGCCGQKKSTRGEEVKDCGGDVVELIDLVVQENGQKHPQQRLAKKGERQPFHQCISL